MQLDQTKEILNAMIVYKNLKCEISEEIKNLYLAKKICIIYLNERFLIVSRDGLISKKTFETKEALKKYYKNHELKLNRGSLNNGSSCININNVKIIKYDYFKKGIKQKTFCVHNIIYRAFNPEFKFSENVVIDHIDGIKSHNNIDNLRAITQQDNLKEYHEAQKQTKKDFEEVKEEFYEFSLKFGNISDDSFNLGTVIYYFNDEITYIGYSPNLIKEAYEYMTTIF